MSPARSRVLLYGGFHGPLLVQLGELAKVFLERLPCGDAVADRLLRGLGHVVARGLATGASIAHVEMRAMLWPRPMTAASGRPASAKRRRERAEDRRLSEARDLGEQHLSSVRRHGNFLGRR